VSSCGLTAGSITLWVLRSSRRMTVKQLEIGKNQMLWIKAFHIIFMVTWFSGIFYLPRLFVYHAQSSDDISNARFKIMERKLFWGIMTPGAIFTIFFGVWMLTSDWEVYRHMVWIHVKLSIVFLLVIYHILLGKWMLDFKHDRNTHGHVFYRIINEVPVIFLVTIVILAIVKPLGIIP
jgi:putative membrane protein